MTFPDEGILKMKEILRCGLCCDVLKDPLTLLGCQHNFCRTCADELQAAKHNVERGGICCPVCQEFCPQKDVRENPLVIKVVNFHNMAAKQKQENDAAERERLRHKPDPAEWKCVDCPLFLCGDCKKKHLMVPMLRDHTMLHIGIKDDPKSSVVHEYCSMHSKMPVKYYCLECNDSFCSDNNNCGTVKHKTNHFSQLEQKSEEPYDKYKKALDLSLEEKMAQIDRDQERIIAKLKRQQREEMEEIKETYKARNEKVEALGRDVDDLIENHDPCAIIVASRERQETVMYKLKRMPGTRGSKKETGIKAFEVMHDKPVLIPEDSFQQILKEQGEI